MGLDSVELVIEIEKAFKIDIPDREAEKISTVQDFYDVVWNHVSHRQSNLCKTQHIFYQLRNHFEKELSIPKYHFRLNAKVNDLLPLVNRHKLYNQMALSTGLNLPPLVLERASSLLLEYLGMLTVAGSALAVVLGVNFYELSKWYWLAPLAGIGFTMLFSRALEFKRVIIPQLTVRKFIEAVFAINYTEEEQHSGINRHEVELVVKQIILDKIGVDESEIIPSARICDDLGVD